MSPVSTSNPDAGRDETEEERLDRKWNDLLQELRVMQTGAQLTAGFLLTLPFQSTFPNSTPSSAGSTSCLVCVAALTTALVMARSRSTARSPGRHVQGTDGGAAHHLVFGVLACSAC